MTFDPALYAAVHRGHPGDVAYYVALARRGQSVLELGAGYGRLAGPLARAGLDYLGLELEPAFIALHDARAQAGEAHAKIVQGDMRSFALGARFDTIIIPFTGLYCLTTEAELVACLGAARAHLRAGGVLAFDAYEADAMHADAHFAEDGDTSEPETMVELDVAGRRYTVLESSTWYPSQQVLEAHYDYVPADGSPTTRQTIRQRYLLSAQVEPLLRAAGFQEVHLYGDFADGPFDEDSALLVVRAR